MHDLITPWRVSATGSGCSEVVPPFSALGRGTVRAAAGCCGCWRASRKSMLSAVSSQQPVQCSAALSARQHKCFTCHSVGVSGASYCDCCHLNHTQSTQIHANTMQPGPAQCPAQQCCVTETDSSQVTSFPIDSVLQARHARPVIIRN